MLPPRAMNTTSAPPSSLNVFVAYQPLPSGAGSRFRAPSRAGNRERPAAVDSSMVPGVRSIDARRSSVMGSTVEESVSMPKRCIATAGACSRRHQVNAASAPARMPVATAHRSTTRLRHRAARNTRRLLWAGSASARRASPSRARRCSSPDARTPADSRARVNRAKSSASSPLSPLATSNSAARRSAPRSADGSETTARATARRARDTAGVSSVASIDAAISSCAGSQCSPARLARPRTSSACNRPSAPSGASAAPDASVCVLQGTPAAESIASSWRLASSSCSIRLASGFVSVSNASNAAGSPHAHSPPRTCSRSRSIANCSVSSASKGDPPVAPRSSAGS